MQDITINKKCLVRISGGTFQLCIPQFFNKDSSLIMIEKSHDNVAKFDTVVDGETVTVDVNVSSKNVWNPVDITGNALENKRYDFYKIV